jgi:hypothetical protein
VQESGLLPLLFFISLFTFAAGFTNNCKSKISSGIIDAPSLARTTLSARASNLFLVLTGAMDKE